MAFMIDKKDETYKGEAKVYECIENNLPEDIICYYNREINGKQFDFCLLIEHMGLLIIEVKGWRAEHVLSVKNPDEIKISLYENVVGSPKKQARSYKFALVNTYNNKYNINPLVMDMVCYPFISEQEYKKVGLHIVSEPEFTLFKEDIEDPNKFALKIVGVYQKANQLTYDNTVGNIYETCKLHFENSNTTKDSPKKTLPYSELRIYPDAITISDIDIIISAYFYGTKQIVFINNSQSVDLILQNIMKKFDAEGIYLQGGNFTLNTHKENDIKSKDGHVGFFNFELFYVDELEDITKEKYVIRNGKLDGQSVSILENIGKKVSFNLQQYMIEHAPISRNIVVKAGAGTGKTYSMISRISYICHSSSGANILDVKNEIAMLTEKLAAFKVKAAGAEKQENRKEKGKEVTM